MISLTTTILRAQGYKISNEFEQPLIDRCVKDILTAYIKPILPTYTDTDEDVLNAVYCLVFILLLSRNAVKTRYGAVKKGVDGSQNIPIAEIEQLTKTADMYLSILQNKEDAEVCPDIKDIANIYPQIFY